MSEASPAPSSSDSPQSASIQPIPASAPPPIEIIPAIDLMDGAVVRLEQGDAKRRTRYDAKPADVARAYMEAGAKRLHVVDLDGAFAGKPRNLNLIGEIADAIAGDMEIEVGGGVRSLAIAQELFGAGVDYVVMGTKALEDQPLLEEMVRAFGNRIIIGADCREGRISTRGWTSDTPIHAVPFLRRMRREALISTVIFTDIARDGMFTSPNLEQLAEVLSIDGLEVIASGGVGSLQDIHALRRLNAANLRGVIIGKALYDGRVSLEDALAAAVEPLPPLQTEEASASPTEGEQQ